MNKLLSIAGLTLAMLWVSAAPQGMSSNSAGEIVIDGVTFEQKPDIGIGINKAYAALPATGGTIVLPPGSFNFATPIVFGTANGTLLRERDSSLRS